VDPALSEVRTGLRARWPLVVDPFLVVLERQPEELGVDDRYLRAV
jgi:hypothetical protein